MAILSRRRFLQAGPAALLARAAQAAKLSTIGVQLYTVRDVLKEKPAETLKAIDSLGYREAEATYATLDQIMPALKATNLKPVSVHFDSTLIIRGSDEEIARALGRAKQEGFSFAVMPYVQPAERGGLDAMRRLAEKLNRTGEKCRAMGLRLAYHNHAFEFEPMEGSTRFQAFLDAADPKLVSIEMDAFWASIAGQNPAALLRKLSGRVPLVHLKDKARGAPVQYNEKVPRETFQEVGHGVINWPEVLSAAAAAGVEHYFVEQDFTPGDPVESLRQSFTYLSKLSF